MKRKWKPVSGYENLYEVSNYGDVRSIERRLPRKDGIIRHVPYKILKPFENHHGYLRVCLAKNGTKKNYAIHRLVANAFVSNPSHFTQINHKDENIKNNCASNLEWCTVQYNNKYGKRGLKISISKGKPVMQMSLTGQPIKEWCSMSNASKHGYGRNGIRLCCLGIRKQFDGYKWKFIEKDEK